MMQDKDGNMRPMVDMTGKFYKLEDLAPEFVQNCMNASDYDPWQGKFVKNAYDDTKTDKDETLDIEICMIDEGPEPGVQDREACPQLPALLAYR